jgi:hypothetical protein
MFSFIETQLFTQLVEEYLNDDQYRELQVLLMKQPEVGAVIRGSGGVRKLRWLLARRGKREGYRILYYLAKPKGVIWMLITMYPKNVAENIPLRILRKIRREIEND